MLLIRTAMILLTAWMMVATGVVTYWLMDRQIPTTILAYVLETPTVHPGGELVMNWLVNRHRHCETTRSDFVIDDGGHRWLTPPITWHTQPGPLGEEKFNTVTAVPSDMPLGSAKLRIIIEYHCNPVQELFWPMRNEVVELPFTVVP